jgi:YegS/Rv2252/BmrU family lipid kinase
VRFVRIIAHKRLLLVFNPKAGVQSLNARLFDVADAFTAAGFLVSVYPTQAAGEVGAAVTALAPGHDMVVCAGGDGSVSEAIDALLSMETRPAFGLIPSGTVNDFAASLGIPAEVNGAVDIILHGTPAAIDIGHFKGDERVRHFTYIAAFGLFTDISYTTSQTAKNWLGRLAYFLEGVRRFGQMTAYPCEFELDGKYVTGDFILGVIANTHSIAGIKMPKGIEARMDDGVFEVILVQKPTTLKESQEIIASLLTQEEKSPLVTICKAQNISFHAFDAVPWTLDGDFGGEHAEITIENQHRAIEIIMPPQNSR